MKVKEIADFLWSKYPNESQEDWDKSGFCVKFNFNRKLTGIVVAIDLTNDVLQKAIATKSNLIITHHPFIFQNELNDEIEKYEYKKKIFKLVQQNKIFVLSLHTNYDIHEHGTSYQIVKKLRLKNAKFKNDGYPCLVDYNTTPLMLIDIMKNELLLNNYRTNLTDEQLKNNISKIAFFSGSGDNIDIISKSKNGYELIITSDVKWSDWIAYNESKVSIIEISHLDEQVFVDDIYNQLKNKLKIKNINVVLLNEQYKNL